MSPKISFVVLTYNRVDALIVVLKALAKQCDVDHEVVIADDGSCALAVQELKQQLPAFRCVVKHVWHPDRGFTASRARNLGALASTGNYLVFLDGDCVPNPRFVEAHMTLAKPGFFVNGNRVLLSERLTQIAISDGTNLSNAGLMDWIVWRFQGDANKLIHRIYWPLAPGRHQSRFHWKKIRSCNFAVWRTDFMSVNGFDESFEGWGHEDADLVLRLHHLGLGRLNGFVCTEVYHLWHRQNSRVSEGVNYQRVMDRIRTGIVKAKIGVQDSLTTSDTVVSILN